MHNYLENGAYDATLQSARCRNSSKDLPMVEFVWRIDGSDHTVKSFLHLKTANGLKNVKGIAMTQVWAPDWDGLDAAWFEQHPELWDGFKVRLTIVNGSSPSNPNHVYSNVKWINLRTGARTPSAPPAVALRDFDAAKLTELPSDLKPSMLGAWSAFAFVTEDWSTAEREAKWFDLIAKVAPGKDQIDFTPADWQSLLSTLNPQPSTLNPQPSTLNPQPSTLNSQPSTTNHHENYSRFTHH